MRHRTPEISQQIVARSARLDWARFHTIISRHRVAGLVHEALAQCGAEGPAEHLSALAQDARRIALQGVKFAAETRRLCALADGAGIEVVILKGSPLAQIAYGTVATKHAKDIDLAVVPGDLRAMRELLLRAGYHAAGPAASKDEPWYHPQRKTQVELHTALVDHPSWLRGLTIRSALDRRQGNSGGGIPTLAPDDLFAYLCVHGVSHGWSRFKWLADLAALVAWHSPSEIIALHAHAAALGAGRQAASSLLLCADLLGTPLSAEHEAGLRRQRVVRWLVGSAMRSFTGSSETVELDTMPLSTLRVHLGQFVATVGWNDRSQLLAAKLGTQSNDGPTRWMGNFARWLRTRYATASMNHPGGQTLP